MNRKHRRTVGAHGRAPSPAKNEAPSSEGNALATAIHTNDWERAALLLLLGVSQVARSLPRTTIHDVIDLLEHEEPGDDRR